MGNLKLKSKKNKTADVASYANKIKLVNDAIAMKLISYVEGEPTALVWPQIFMGKDRTFIKNFADNLWMYWKIHSGKMPEETANMVLTIKEPEEQEILFTYSDKEGLVII